jgi:hypothetical protein
VAVPDPSQSTSNESAKGSDANDNGSGVTPAEVAVIPDTGGDADSVNGDNRAATGDSGRGVADSGGDNQAGVNQDNREEETPRESNSTYGPSQRAYHLRKKRAKGTLSDSDIAWLEEYEANKGKGKKQEPKSEKPEPRNTPTPPVLTRSPNARIPRAPVVHETQSWRGKHNGGSENGRELLCTMFADQWHQILCTMEKEIVEAGMSPIVQVSNQDFRSLLILAVDDMLPDWLKATPAIVVAYKSTALTTQRLAKAKAIKEAKEKKERSIQVLRPGSSATTITPPAPTPTPAPTEPPVNGSPAAKEIINVNQDGRILPKLPSDHVIR